MTSQRGIERGRGAKESGQQLAVLRAKWPLAFPIKPRDVRPLAASVVGEIAATMSWSVAYTRGVLFVWKMGPVYCQAVLSHDHRITLDVAFLTALVPLGQELWPHWRQIVVAGIDAGENLCVEAQADRGDGAGCGKGSGGAMA